MLVLGRKAKETIIVDGRIRVTLVRCTGHGARIGIEAPAGVPIVRAELVELLGSTDESQAEPAESVRERLLDNSAASSATPAPVVPSVPRPTWPAPVPR